MTVATSGHEDLEDWNIVDISTFPHDCGAPREKLDASLESVSSPVQPETKDKPPPSPSVKPEVSRVQQRNPSGPVRGNRVARAVLAIEQAISHEAEEPENYRNGYAAEKLGQPHPMHIKSKECACKLICTTSSREMDGAVHCTMGWRDRRSAGHKSNREVEEAHRGGIEVGRMYCEQCDIRMPVDFIVVSRVGELEEPQESI